MPEEEAQVGREDEATLDEQALLQKKKLLWFYAEKERTLNDEDIGTITIQIRPPRSALLRRAPGRSGLGATFMDTDPRDPIKHIDADKSDRIRHTDPDPTDPGYRPI
jgi:hypothetical protein